MKKATAVLLVLLVLGSLTLTGCGDVTVKTKIDVTIEQK